MSATIAAARHVWTTDEYLRAAQAGVFAPDVRTELIEGEIIEMSAQGADHIRAVMKTNEWLRETFAGVAHVRIQTTLRLGARRVPEPDLAVVRGSVNDAPIFPPVSDILLVVEVSDWTLAFDRSDKARLYARGRGRLLDREPEESAGRGASRRGRRRLFRRAHVRRRRVRAASRRARRLVPAARAGFAARPGHRRRRYRVTASARAPRAVAGGTPV